MHDLVSLPVPPSVVGVPFVTSGLADVCVAVFLSDAIVAVLETEEQDLDDRQQTGSEEDAQLAADLRDEAVRRQRTQLLDLHVLQTNTSIQPCLEQLPFYFLGYSEENSYTTYM